MKKKYLIGTGIVLVLLAAILLGAGQYMLNYSLRPDNRGKGFGRLMAVYVRHVSLFEVMERQFAKCRCS